MPEKNKLEPSRDRERRPHEAPLDSRINAAEVLTTQALVEMDPWTQEWIRRAEEEAEMREDT